MNIFKWIVQMGGKRAVGALFGASFTVVIASVTYRAYQDSKTGDVQGLKRVEKTVAKNDAQGDVRLKMEGLKDEPKDAAANTDAAKKAAEAVAEEAAKYEEQLKAQKEAEEAALAEQQAQGEDGVAADEGQNADDFKDENADEGDGESEAETEAETEDNEQGSDTYKGGNEDNDEKFDENGETVDPDGSEQCRNATRDGRDSRRAEGGKQENRRSAGR